MQEQVYKNLTAVFDTLNNIVDLITNKQPQEFEDIKQDVREWIDNCCVILETIEQTVSNLNDFSSEKILNKARRNLYAMDSMVFNRFDVSKFDSDTHKRFKEKMDRWITYYIDQINEIRMSYYIYDDHNDHSDIKVALCCIVKMENRYIREFIKHYKSIGVDHIAIYDNNDPDGEHLSDVIQDYIDDGYVTVYDVRGKVAHQMKAYKEFYTNHYTEYDWICYFDTDEFLILNQDKNIKDYLSRECFNDAHQIHINWKMFTDNDHLYYDDKPVMERFSEPVPNGRDGANKHIKSIVRTTINKEIVEFDNPHTINGPGIKTVNNAGSFAINGPFYYPPNYELAQLNHYYTKSAEEYLTRLVKGRADSGSKTNIKNLKDHYFSINEQTPEKLEAWNKLSEKYNIK